MRFATQDGIGPAIPIPEISNSLEDLKLPIDAGISPEKPLAPRPNFLKDTRLLMEPGIIPEKFVLPIFRFSKLLPFGKSGK